jgi:sarcosine oxidase, subunit gamma
MPDVIAHRRSALSGVALPNLAGAVAVREAGTLARFIYRGAPDALGADFGPRLPVEPCRAATESGRTALWLGPDEWLLLADGHDADSLLVSMRGKIAAQSACLVDVGHRNIGLVVEGPRAADLLCSACPIDLDITHFPVGMCARTLFGKAEIVAWRTATDSFHVEVWRSFAPYVAALLCEAAGGLPQSET